MADKFRNKYRIPSARLQFWDYGANAAYFITICTKNNFPFFGTIVQSPNLGDSLNTSKLGHSQETPGSGFSAGMVLSDIGMLAEKYWFEIPLHFPFVKLGAFVVMHNHIHGIIVIDKFGGAKNKETPRLGVSTDKWKPGTLGVIVNQYKRIITINARKTTPSFAWLPRFYDTIIRNDRAYTNISNYIIDNPRKWASDHFDDNGDTDAQIGRLFE